MNTRTLFPGQQDDEQISLVIREHWFYLFLKMFLWIILLVALWAFMQYGPDKIPFVFQDPFSKYINILVKIFVTFITLGIFVTWSMYYLNTDIITSIRIVDISQDGLFQHTVSELRLMNIEDVTGETKGILGNIFAFGNVYVQTAGKEERFTFQNVPHPDKVEQLIQDLCEVAEKQPVPIKASQPE